MARAFLLKIAIGLLAGGWLGYHVPFPVSTFAVLLGLFLTICLVCYFGKQFAQAFWLFCLASAVLLGLLLTRQSIELESDRFATLYGPVDRLAVQVVSDPYLERHALVKLLEGEQAGRLMRVPLSNLPANPSYGQILNLTGTAHGRKIAPKYWEPFEGTAPVRTPYEQASAACLAFRDWVDRKLAAGQMPHGFLAFARAELFGKRGELDDRTLRILQEHGLTHVIAVSGMHTTLLAAILFFLLGPLLGVETAVAVTIAAVTAFTIMVGLQPSVVRAAITTALGLIGTTMKQPVRILNLTAAAFIAEFIVFPEHLTSAGFQLSYLAMMGIGISEILIRNQERESPETPAAPVPAWIRWVLPLLLIQVFTAPLTAHLFYRWSPLSIVSNLLVLPVFTFLIALAASGAVAAPVWPELSRYLFWIGDATLDAMVRALDAVSRFLNASSTYGELPAAFLIVFYAAWIIFVLWGTRSRRAALIACGMLLAALAAYPVIRNSMSDRQVIAGGDRIAYVLIQTGGSVEFAHISAKAGETPEAFRPMIKDLLRSGIRRIGELVAPPRVKALLELEFPRDPENRKPAGWDVRPDGFAYERDGLEIQYARGGLPPEFSARSKWRWLILEPARGTRIDSVRDLRLTGVYLVGAWKVEVVRSLFLKFEEAGVPNVLAAQVDGPLRIWRVSGEWRHTTKLAESLDL